MEFVTNPDPAAGSVTNCMYNPDFAANPKPCCGFVAFCRSSSTQSFQKMWFPVTVQSLGGLRQEFLVVAANVAGMERAQAEAIFDAGRDACVKFILDLAGKVEDHGDQIRRLETEARQDSRTSSKPPSQDPPKTRAQRRAEARAKAKELARAKGGGRKAGGQKGHPGSGRELLPEDQVDRFVDHWPAQCNRCGQEFDDQQRRAGGQFGRHQVADLPPISVVLVEHRTHQLRCRHCRSKTTAPLPSAVAGSAFGPGLQAAVVTLTARHRVSRRGICELARDLFGVSVSTGAVDDICQRASDALAGPHCALHDWVLDQDAVHVDETGWKTRGDGRALWTVTTLAATLLKITERCDREQFDALIGTAYAGIVISDRWPGFEHLDPLLRQACWSHLQRDFRRHAEGVCEQKMFGERALALTALVFAGWRAFQHDHHDRQRLARELKPVKDQLHQLLQAAGATRTHNSYHQRFANNLLKIWPALWTFVTVDGVEPTNNPAERALRGPVIHRKLSLGTQSDNGERFAERALSAAATCRQQRRSLFAYLAELFATHARGDPFPALT